MKEEFNFESIKPKTIEQQKAGKPLFDKDCAFTTLLGNMLNVALKGEMDVHILQKTVNRSNGKMQKLVHTPFGEVTVSTPLSSN